MKQRMNDAPRLLFITNSMGTGGVGNQLYNICTRLQQREYDIKIVSLRPLGRFGKKTVEKGIDVKSLELNHKFSVLVAIYKIKRIIQTFDPDIVHTHLFHASLIGRIAVMGENISLITTIHNTYDKNPDNHDETIRDRFYSITDFLVDLTTFVSSAAHNRYVQTGTVSSKNSCCVPNGIDMDEFKPLESNSNNKQGFTWTIVGNLQEQKDHHTLLKALSQLSRDKYDINMVIVGEGKLRHDLESLSNKLNITDIVSFEGRVESVPEYLSVSDAFVLSSRWEGFGLVVAEAMACELPVVATNTGGPSEIIDDGKTGFLAERGSPKDLAEKMQTVMDLSPEERDAFGKRGRQRIKNNYSIEQTVSDWINIYEKYTWYGRESCKH